MNTPLAERMRPKTLADYYGQEHLVGPQGSLTQMIKNGVFPSLIFWGPSRNRKNNTCATPRFRKGTALFINFLRSMRELKKYEKSFKKPRIREAYLAVKVPSFLSMKSTVSANLNKTPYSTQWKKES
jgi:replication-associated recombination protein RarA